MIRSPKTYDRIGVGYASKRRSDVRLARQIHLALGDARSIVNVGAGAGSYEPADRTVVAVEPAVTMIRQRGALAAPAIQACAEALPLAPRSFDAAMAVLTIHHWRDWRAGLREMARVARERVILFTWDPDSVGFWMRDYFPVLLERDRQRFPAVRGIEEIIGPVCVVPVPIPHDCTDGFMGAYWRRPEAYLTPEVRRAISTLAVADLDSGLARLEADLASGEWRRKYERMLSLEELDLGYRLLIATSAAQPGIAADERLGRFAPSLVRR
jgi:SAM-dependent methyltransferase